MLQLALHTYWGSLSNDEREVLNRSIIYNKGKPCRQIGRQQTHIEGLWEEIGFKNENIDSLHKQLMELNTKFKDLYKKLYEMEIRKSSAEKNMTEFFGERTDN